MIDFRFMYEHKAREMESIALMMYELKKRGYTCDFFPCNGMGGKPKEMARVVVTPYLYNDAHLEALERYTKGNSKLINLQWEQVFKAKFDGDPSFFHYPKEHAKEAIHLCWGQHEAESLYNCGIEREKVYVTGPVHMDFLRPEFKGYYSNKQAIAKKYSLDADKEWILFISSFSGNARKTDADGRVIDETDADKAKTIFLNWIEKILDSRKDSIFIYRPHPNEKTDPRLAEMQSKYLNFHVYSDLSVKQWILVAEKIITWMSTSTGEIYFSGKNCIIARPIEIKKEEDMITLVDATKVDNIDDLLEQLKHPSIFPIKDEVMLEFYNFEEKPSYIRICNVLEEVLYSNISEDLNVSVNYPVMLKLKKKFSKSPFYYGYIKRMSSIPTEKEKKCPYFIKNLIENSKMRYRDFITNDEMECLKERFAELQI